jgi:hypothetical protein
MANHPNRNWKRKWALNADSSQATHECGLIARYHRVASGDWTVESPNGPQTLEALVAAGEQRAAQRIERLIWEAGELFKRSLERRQGRPS